MRVFGLLRVADESPGGADPGHTGTPLGKQPRVVPLPAANVKAGKAIDLRQHLEEGQGIRAVAGVIVAGPYQLRPCFGRRHTSSAVPATNPEACKPKPPRKKATLCKRDVPVCSYRQR